MLTPVERFHLRYV